MTYKENITIPTYIINLKERTDRYEHTIREFQDKPEFDLHIVEAIKNTNGALGLWESIRTIVKNVQEQDDDVIIIGEDDHTFTSDYNREIFFTNIVKASQLGTHILLGGVGMLENLVAVTKGLFWIDIFWSTQFMILFRPVFSKILNSKFEEGDVADEFISKIVSNKMLIYPFISYQKDFGYSDVTVSNNQVGRISSLFEHTQKIGYDYTRIMRKYDINFPVDDSK
jgi:hypothetical protein